MSSSARRKPLPCWRGPAHSPAGPPQIPSRCSSTSQTAQARRRGPNAAGRPALFLLAQIIFRREAAGDDPRSRLLGLTALAILAVVTSPLTMIAGIAASSAVLVAVAIADTMGEGDQAPSTLG